MGPSRPVLTVGRVTTERPLEFPPVAPVTRGYSLSPGTGWRFGSGLPCGTDEMRSKPQGLLHPNPMCPIISESMSSVSLELVPFLLPLVANSRPSPSVAWMIASSL